MLDGLPKCLWRVSNVVNHRSNQCDHQKEGKISSSYTGIRTSTITETDTPTPVRDSLNVKILSVQYGDTSFVRILRPLLCTDTGTPPLYGYRDPSFVLISRPCKDTVTPPLYGYRYPRNTDI